MSLLIIKVVEYKLDQKKITISIILVTKANWFCEIIERLHSLSLCILNLGGNYIQFIVNENIINYFFLN